MYPINTDKLFNKKEETGMLSFFVRKSSCCAGGELNNKEDKKEGLAQAETEVESGADDVKVENHTGGVDMDESKERMKKEVEEKRALIASLYPTNLKGLNLSFDESIYAIAFGLQDEIRAHGEEVVFDELGMSAEKMHERVEYCLTEKMYKSYANALRLVLNGVDSLTDDAVVCADTKRLADDFAAVVRALSETSNVSYSNFRRYKYTNYRHLLTQSESLKKQCEFSPSNADDYTKQLYTEVQQLMDEVRFYDEKRDQALERIEKLMAEIKQRQDCPKDFGMKAESQEIKLLGTSDQIAWPYRSVGIIRRLGLKTVDEVIQHFCDFDNFVKSEDITLLEWWVITTILRKKELLPAAHYTLKLDDEIGKLELSVRAHNALKWSGISDFDDFAVCFAFGAKDGLECVRRMRHCGKVSYAEIVQKLGETSVELDDSLCYLTPASHVRALDFDGNYRERLLSCGLDTVGELLAACQDQNRFSGLRYVDNPLYLEAKAQLNRYGFSC